MWSEGCRTSEQGLADKACDSQQSRQALVTSWSKDWHSCCSQVLLSHPLVVLQLYFLLLLDNHQLWVHLPFPQQVTSEPSHCPHLSGCPCPVEIEHSVNKMMKKYLSFLSREWKWTISSFFFPLYYSRSWQSQVGVLVFQHYMLNR